MPIATLSGPLTYPVTLGEARDHLRVDGDHDDAAITRAVAAATAACERHAQARFMRQIIRWTTAPSVEGNLILPLGPVRSVDLVVVTTAAGDVVLPPADYVCTGVGERITGLAMAPGRCWPAPAAIPYPVAVTLTVGWLPAELPGDVRSAVLMATARYYEDRQGNAGLTETIAGLLMGIAP